MQSQPTIPMEAHSPPTQARGNPPSSSNANHDFVRDVEKTHGRALRRFLAARMRRARADVPDLVQEVFLRLLRVSDRESIRNPQAYLYTIASHVLYQYALRQPPTPAALEPAEISAEIAASIDSDPAEQVELEQRFETLGQELELHAPRAYATLMMYRCEGATLEQIGKRLGVTRVMAKKYLTKAMTYCEHRLHEMGEPCPPHGSKSKRR